MGTEKWLEDTAKSAENGRREIIMKWSDRTQRVGTMSNMNTPALEHIEKKTAASTDSAEVGRQWLQIQKLRAKLKKKVDTRASKGRKVRYDIHTKLVNFMAPIS